MSALITDAIVEKAARAAWLDNFGNEIIGPDDDWRKMTRAALLAALPDIGEALAKAMEDIPRHEQISAAHQAGVEDAASVAVSVIRALTGAKP